MILITQIASSKRGKGALHGWYTGRSYLFAAAGPVVARDADPVLVWGAHLPDVAELAHVGPLLALIL